MEGSMRLTRLCKLPSGATVRIRTDGSRAAATPCASATPGAARPGSYRVRPMQLRTCMGMLLVLAVILAFVGVGWLFIHALRTPEGEGQHGWRAVLPLVVIFGWVVEQLVVH